MHALPEGGDQMRYRTLITIGAVVAACGALGAAPALASQSSAPHQAVGAAARPGHVVAVPDTALNGGAGCDVMNCFLADVGGICVANDGVHCTPFRTPVLGKVNQTANCWPFSDCRFDTLSGYSGQEVLQFIDQDTGLCLQTDSVHSGVFSDACGSHNAGTYWVTVGNGGSGGGACVNHPTWWLVNVGITNHYDPYPYGEALFYDTNANPAAFYVATRQPISDNNQFCTIPVS